MDAFIRIVVGLVLIAILLTNFGSLAYLLGLVFWFIDYIFNFSAYVGASCDFITTIKTAFYWVCVLFIGFGVINMFKHW